MINSNRIHKCYIKQYILLYNLYIINGNKNLKLNYLHGVIKYVKCIIKKNIFGNRREVMWQGPQFYFAMSPNGNSLNYPLRLWLRILLEIPWKTITQFHVHDLSSWSNVWIPRLLLSIFQSDFPSGPDQDEFVLIFHFFVLPWFYLACVFKNVFSVKFPTSLHKTRLKLCKNIAV